MSSIDMRTVASVAIVTVTAFSASTLSTSAAATERGAERARTEDGHTRRYAGLNAQDATVTRNARVVNDPRTGTRSRDVVWTEADGRQTSRSDTTRRTDTGYTRDSAGTLPDGRTVTREADFVHDPEAGTRTRAIMTTGADGRTRTIRDTTERTDDGYTRSTVVANPDGATAIRDVSASRDAQRDNWRRGVSVDRDPPDAN